jgi:hypothetical protein
MGDDKPDLTRVLVLIPIKARLAREEEIRRRERERIAAQEAADAVAEAARQQAIRAEQERLEYERQELERQRQARLDAEAAVLYAERVRAAVVVQRAWRAFFGRLLMLWLRHIKFGRQVKVKIEIERQLPWRGQSLYFGRHKMAVLVDQEIEDKRRDPYRYDKMDRLFWLYDAFRWWTRSGPDPSRVRPKEEYQERFTDDGRVDYEFNPMTCKRRGRMGAGRWEWW